MTEQREPERPKYLLRTLGSFELRTIEDDGREGERVLGPGKPLAILAYCLAARDRRHSRDALAGLLWSDAEPTRARQSLRQALWRLGRDLGPIFDERDDAFVRVDRGIASDRERLLAALDRGDVREAIESYRGAFLDGVSFPGGDEFDDWVQIERRHLEDRLVREMASRLPDEVARGQRTLVRSAASRLEQAAPDHLEAQRVAGEALLACGDVTGARRALARIELLQATADVRVTAATMAFVARVQSTTPASPPSDNAISLDLVGRADEFGMIVEAWRRAQHGQTEILFIQGAAGIGKSRLITAFSDRCAGRKVHLVSLRANPGEREVPFGFAASITRALASLPGAAGIGSESARELIALDPGLATAFHAEPSTSDGGEAVRRRGLAILELISVVADERPLAMLLDDLHWSDTASRQLLRLVLHRATAIPLLVVGTSRTSITGLSDEREWPVITLSRLQNSDSIDAIRSSGTWPDDAGAATFVDVLARHSDGVPLQILERLALLEDRGLIGRTDDRWSSPDWLAAADAASVATPIDLRIAECDRSERDVLLALSLVGAPVAADLLHAMPESSESAITASLRSLETRGLVVLTDHNWTVSHDLVAERSGALATPDERQATHARIGRTMARSANRELRVAAIRHLLLGGEDAAAGDVFSRLVQQARRENDRRPAREILASVGVPLGDVRTRALLTHVRWVDRIHRPVSEWLVAACVIGVAMSGLFAWKALQRPSLSFSQAPLMMLHVPLLGEDVYQLSPPAIVTTGRAGDSAIARLTAVYVSGVGDVKMVTIDSAVVEHGQAAFGALRLRTNAELATIRFQAPGYTPLELTLPPLRRNEDHVKLVPATARVVSGRVADQILDTRKPVVRMARGDNMSGVVQLEYSATWRTASVWLSSTPTWGTPSKVGRELFPVEGLVHRAVIDVPVDVRVPDVPGRWWMLFLIDAEPSGGYTLSNTNWTMERPVWNDGNDLAALGDQLIRQGVAAGRLETLRAFPLSHETGPCETRPRRIDATTTVKYCSRPTAMAGFEVIVE